MHVTRVRIVLWLTAAVAGLGAAVAAIGLAAWPLRVTVESGATTDAGRAPAVPATGSTSPSLESFQKVWDLPLRRPLIEAAPPPAVTESPIAKPAAPRVRLIGTIMDGHHPRGVFLAGLTSVELKAVGDTTGGAKVLAIEANAARLLFEGNTFVISREKNPFDPSGSAYESAAQATPASPKAPADGGS